MKTPDLLVEATRLKHGPADEIRIAALAQRVGDWDALLAEAEAHGMAPLLYRTLRAAGAPMPDAATHALQGLYLSHRHANGVRARVLQEALGALQVEGVEALVVKGGALCHLLYPEPGLRPMSDLDLLVRPDAIEPARQALRALGFAALQGGDSQPDKSLPTAGLKVDGVWVGIELHYDLFEAAFDASMGLDDLTAEPLAFVLGENGPTARTLGWEDLLWHLCAHLRFHASVFRRWRLIWVTDILTLVERRGDAVDWQRIARGSPDVLQTLALLACLRPVALDALPAKVAEQAMPKPGHLPRGVGEDFDGWPRHSLAAQRDKGWARILHDTWLPPEWWLRLHHGLGASDPLWRVRWLSHPAEMLGWFGDYVRSRGAARRRRANMRKGGHHAHQAG